MRPFRLPRRTFLHGLGTAIALPALEAMSGLGSRARAGGIAPQRLLVFFFGNGVIPERWTPGDTGPDWTPSEELAPLAGVKDYVSVVSGFDVKTPDHQMHHTGACGMMSGYPIIEIVAGNGDGDHSSKFGGPSIDQVAADLIGSRTPFPSLQLAVSKRPRDDEGTTCQYLSHKGPDQPLPPTTSPADLFTKLFGAVGPTDPDDPLAALRVSVLDAVEDDVARLRPRLSASDKQRLDAHLTGISELRQQLLAAPPVCTLPDPVTDQNEDVDGIERISTVSHLMSDLVALAFACDMTRVLTYQFHGAQAWTIFSDLGHGTDEHALTHSDAQDDVHDTVVYVMDHFAYLLAKLRDTPDLEGNLLDNSCVLCVTECSRGYDHSIVDMPILVAGKAGGYLRYPGVHYREVGANTSDVLLTCMQAVGTGVTSVGGDEGTSETPCAGIVA